MTIPTPDGKFEAEKIADNILDNFIEFEAWRDNLHKNDLPFLKAQIMSHLEKAYSAGQRACEQTHIALQDKWHKAGYEDGQRAENEACALILEGYSHVCRCEMDMKLGGAKAIRSRLLAEKRGGKHDN